MKVLITGATGLVGRELISLFLKYNYEINFLTSSKNKTNSIPECKGYYWSPKKGYVEQGALDEVDTIINLAGASVSKRWTTAYKNKILKSRIDSLNTLYKLLKSSSHQVKHLITASATGIYPHSFSEVYDEKSESIGKGFLAQVVSQWEASANKFKSLDVKVSCIRIGLVMSNKGGVLPKLIGPVKFNLGSTLGTGKQMQSWIHIEDLARIFEWALKNKYSGVINGTAPHPVNQKEFTLILSQIMGKRVFLPPVPQWVLKLLLGEMHLLLFDSQHVIPQTLLLNDFKFKYPELKSALIQLIKN